MPDAGKWEYHIERWSWGSSTDDQIRVFLNHEGDKGWELVSVLCEERAEGTPSQHPPTRIFIYKRLRAG
jgi:hypothetical protein